MTSILDRLGKTPDTLPAWSGGSTTGTSTGPGGSTSTNLAVTTSATTVTITSDTGADAILTAATTTKAGILSAADKTKLDGLSATPSGTSTPTNLAVAARGANSLDVTSDTGTDATLPAATSALAGLMSAADKTKLDGLSGAAGGGAPVYRKANVVANGVTGFIVLTGFGTQAQLDAATVTPSADGATITVAALAAGFVLASVSAHLPDGFTSASTSAFSFVLPANFGVNALDSLPIVDLVRFNAAGMRQAQTNIGVSVTGTAVTVTQTGLTGGVAARFKATAL